MRDCIDEDRGSRIWDSWRRLVCRLYSVERRAGWRKERQPWRRERERERESGQLHTASQKCSDNTVERREKEKGKEEKW